MTDVLSAIELTHVEKVYALHRVYPFDRLNVDDLLTIAAAATERVLKPNTVVCPQGGTVNNLYIRIAGDLVDPVGEVMQPVVGTTLLLTSRPAPFEIRVGPNGYRGLTIPRGKFFTMVNQCPSLLVGFFQMPLIGVDVRSLKDSPR